MLDAAEVETEASRILVRAMNCLDGMEQAKIAGAAWQTRVVWFQSQYDKLMIRYKELTGEDDE